MKIMKSFPLRQSFFALILLFTIYGCNTTNNTTATKASGSNLKPDITQADSEVPKPAKPQSSPAEHHEEAVADKKSGLDEKQAMEKFHKRLGSFITGHGGGPENTREDRNTTSTKKSTKNPTAKI